MYLDSLSRHQGGIAAHPRSTFSLYRSMNCPAVIALLPMTANVSSETGLTVCDSASALLKATMTRAPRNAFRRCAIITAASLPSLPRESVLGHTQWNNCNSIRNRLRVGPVLWHHRNRSISHAGLLVAQIDARKIILL